MKWEETSPGLREGQRIGSATGIPALHVDVQVDDSSQNAESDGAELLVLFCLKIAALGCLSRQDQYKAI